MRRLFVLWSNVLYYHRRMFVTDSQKGKAFGYCDIAFAFDFRVGAYAKLYNRVYLVVTETVMAS
jgi:hypothetical protein